MNYRDLMQALSCCGVGAILSAQDDTILDVNEAGDRLLHGEGELKGRPLREAAPALCGDGEETWNPAFNEYLTACPTPELPGLPPQTRLLLFRDSTKEIRHDILMQVFNHMPEAVTVWDREGRILMLNCAAERLESHLTGDVLGDHNSDLYKAQKDSVLVIPLVLSEGRPILNLRQNFVTHTGKKLQIVSNNYPLQENGNLLGAMSMMEDLSALDTLSKRVIDLQRSLAGERQKPKSSHGPTALTAKYHFSDIIYTGPAMRRTLEKCQMIAESDSPVMIYGETGTGKELFAQSIHNASARCSAPFIAINCAAIPSTLLESMLFGTEKGAYTGAMQREGLLEQAHKGTLLLDEINSMDITLQSKLLRVLQDGIIRRVGGLNDIQVDVRIISNTNIPPMQAIEQKQLRKDLYYRLGVVNITVPPLRERREDIPLLAKVFLVAGNEKIRKNVSNVDEEVLRIFSAYAWPGNVRELQHAIEYALNILPPGQDVVTPAYIPDHIRDAVGAREWRHADDRPAKQICTVKEAMDEAARRLILKTLEEKGGNISESARILGMTRQNLQHYIKKLEIELGKNADFPK